MTQRSLAFAILCAALLTGTATLARDSQRPQEILECRSGEMVTWNDGVDRPAKYSPLLFLYAPAGAPLWFPEAVVAEMIAKAATAWSPCGVPGKLLRPEDLARTPQAIIRVQWDEAASPGVFALANLNRNTLSLNPGAFQQLRQRNPRHDAGETLQMVISHEMGHFFGLMAHSRRCVDVLSYYHNGKGETCLKRDPLDTGGVTEYRHRFPTACDIARCRQVNGQPNTPPRQP